MRTKRLQAIPSKSKPVLVTPDGWGIDPRRLCDIEIDIVIVRDGIIMRKSPSIPDTDPLISVRTWVIGPSPTEQVYYAIPHVVPQWGLSRGWPICITYLTDGERWFETDRSRRKCKWSQRITKPSRTLHPEAIKFLSRAIKEYLGSEDKPI